MKKAKSYYNFRNQNVFDRTVIITGTLYVQSKTFLVFTISVIFSVFIDIL